MTTNAEKADDGVKLTGEQILDRGRFGHVVEDVGIKAKADNADPVTGGEAIHFFQNLLIVDRGGDEELADICPLRGGEALEEIFEEGVAIELKAEFHAGDTER